MNAGRCQLCVSRFCRIIAVTAGLAWAALGAGAATYYVTEDGQDEAPGDGSAANPWLTISNALYHAVDDDAVIVSNGTYDLTEQLEVTAKIRLRGYSGDPADTVVNANQTGRCLLITHTGAVVSAMTVSNGYIGADLGGGGIRMTGGTVSNCVITHNISTNVGIRGAGIYMSGGQVINCDIMHNVMTDTSQVPNGGGIYLIGSGLISGCTIDYNRYNTGAGSGRGAGVFLYNGGMVEKCEFTANRCYGGAVQIDGNGIVSNSSFVYNTNALAVIVVNTDNSSPVLISDCSFVSNANNYTTIWLAREAIIEDCDISHNTISHAGYATLPVAAGMRIIMVAAGKTNLIRRCRIMHNQATKDPMFAEHYGPAAWVSSNTIFENCLIAGNNRGGVYVQTNGLNAVLSSCTISSNGNYGVFFDGMDGFRAAATNCIVYHNEVDVTNRLAAATNDFWYCCAAADLPAAQGNLAGPPAFVDAAADDYQLAGGSPCINRGLNQPWMESALDLAGNRRIMMMRTDIGAYESWPPPATIFILR